MDFFSSIRSIETSRPSCSFKENGCSGRLCSACGCGVSPRPSSHLHEPIAACHAPRLFRQHQNSARGPLSLVISLTDGKGSHCPQMLRWKECLVYYFVHCAFQMHFTTTWMALEHPPCNRWSYLNYKPSLRVRQGHSGYPEF